jgi:hypothetical protein
MVYIKSCIYYIFFFFIFHKSEIRIRKCEQIWATEYTKREGGGLSDCRSFHPDHVEGTNCSQRKRFNGSLAVDIT